MEMIDIINRILEVQKETLNIMEKMASDICHLKAITFWLFIGFILLYLVFIWNSIRIKKLEDRVKGQKKGEKVNG